jgi:hypothetical protein
LTFADAIMPAGARDSGRSLAPHGARDWFAIERLDRQISN